MFPFFSESSSSNSRQIISKRLCQQQRQHHHQASDLSGFSALKNGRYLIWQQVCLQPLPLSLPDSYNCNSTVSVLKSTTSIRSISLSTFTEWSGRLLQVYSLSHFITTAISKCDKLCGLKGATPSRLFSKYKRASASDIGKLWPAFLMLENYDSHPFVFAPSPLVGKHTLNLPVPDQFVNTLDKLMYIVLIHYFVSLALNCSTNKNLVANLLLYSQGISTGT